MSRTKWCTGVLLSILCLSITMSINQSSKSLASDSHNISINHHNYPNDIYYTEFISINKDEDFLNYNITGLGTKDDPYIIENIVLDREEYNNGVAVRDTTKYFVIRNCTLKAWWSCIIIANVSEGTANIYNNTCFVWPPSLGSVGIGIVETNGAMIRNNNCTRERGHITFFEGTYGIFLQNSNNTIVVENICEKQDMHGIISNFSKNNLIERNYCILNSVGIDISYSTDDLVQYNQVEQNRFGILGFKSRFSIINNTANSNEEHGIGLQYCTLTNVTANNISFNGYRKGYGLYGNVADMCEFTYNQFINNTDYGLFLDRYSDNNTIHHNRFVYNKVGGESQALDHGKNNTWYDVNALEGNYWNDWDSRKPYPIIGGADAEDKYPLNESFQRISFSTRGAVMTVLVLSTISISLKKKKKKRA